MSNRGGGAFNYGNVPVRIKGDGDYRSKLAEAQALQDNAFIFGMQSMANEGSGSVVSANRHPQYGNTNLTTGRGIGGEQSNFQPQTDSMGNVITTDYGNQTGFGPNSGLSASSSPHDDPRSIGQNAEMRVQALAGGVQFPCLLYTSPSPRD